MNLVQHLPMKHVKVHKWYSKGRQTAKEMQRRTLQQLLLVATEERIKIWDINDPRAQRITRKVDKIIAKDCHPLSVVEDVKCLKH